MCRGVCLALLICACGGGGQCIGLISVTEAGYPRTQEALPAGHLMIT